MNVLSKTDQPVPHPAQHKIWPYILIPFLATRALLAITAYFGRFIADIPAFPELYGQKYFLSPVFLVDIWSRWDAKWYLNLVKEGYVLPAHLITTYSDLAFFPLYPVLVKLFTLLIPGGLQSNTIILSVGILFSTVCFLTALYLIYKMVMMYQKDEAIARLTVLLMITFPTSFFFNSFYTEGLFLLLTAGMFSLALHKHWIWAALLAALATLTRPQGIIILIPLAWMYMEARQWKIKAIDWDGLALGIAPACLLGHFVYLKILTGDPLAFFHSEQAWNRDGSIGDLTQLLRGNLKFIYIDIAFCVLFSVIGIYLLIKKRTDICLSPAFSIYVLVSIFIPLLTGSWQSFSRFMSVLFPAFMGLGWLTRKKWVGLFLATLFMLVQIVGFIFMVNYIFFE